MNERLKRLRKSLGLTQSEFGKKIDLTDAMISRFESGQIIPQNGTIKLICLTFGVNEEWLLTGEGDMIDSENGLKLKRLIGIFNKLSPSAQNMILDYVEKIYSYEQEILGISQDKPKQNSDQKQVG